MCLPLLLCPCCPIAGVDVSECDVCWSKDLVPVCRHEPYLSATTDALTKFPAMVSESPPLDGRILACLQTAGSSGLGQDLSTRPHLLPASLMSHTLIIVLTLETGTPNLCPMGGRCSACTNFDNLHPSLPRCMCSLSPIRSRPSCSTAGGSSVITHHHPYNHPV